MNNSMVAHLWANEKQESANGSNFYFEGESIYSYGRHFEVGRIVRNKRGEKAYLINDTYYSSTTSKHQYYVREAIPTGSKVFYVECNISYCIGNMLFVTNMLECIKDAIEKYKKARTDESERQKLVDALKASKEPEAKEYLKRFFGIEEKPKYDFKPFDKVLVRDEDDKEWHISLFAREIVDDSDGLSYKYECSNGTLWDCCIPFEGNECLLETAENPEK